MIISTVQPDYAMARSTPPAYSYLFLEFDH